MIDTHAHIYLSDFDGDRIEIIQRAKDTGLTKILMPNLDAESIDAMLALEVQFPDYCYSTMGLHPTSVKKDFEKQLGVVHEWLNKRPFKAVGEIGIDLYWDNTYLSEQLISFEEQIKWAKELNLPIIIHCRDAFPEVFSVIEKLLDNSLRGVFHSFSGSEEEASRILEYGSFFIGINGVVTFKNSKLYNVLKKIPIEKLLIETDAPYLTPDPYRGKRNEPSYVKFIVEQLARVYELSFEKLDILTTDNANSLFFLDNAYDS